LALALIASAPVAATGQVAPSTNNQIVLSKDVVGAAPPGTVFAISVQCTALDEPPGEPPTLPGVSVVDQTVTFDAHGNPSQNVVDVPAITSRDDGFVLCGINEDVATRPAILTPPTVVVSDPGTSRAANPATDPVVGGPVDPAAGVQFPYTRSGAIVHVTFTNTYAEPPPSSPPPVVVNPVFTG
jgi:hypothetical protein